MALTETVVLNITSAQRQIDQLEADLAKLSKPLNVDVDVEGTRAADELRQDFAQADNAVNSLNNELEETGRELRNVDQQAEKATNQMLGVGSKGAAAFQRLQTSVVAAAGAFALIAGARAFLTFADQAIGKASDLAESLSKTEVVFGGLSDQIKTFASGAPEALGLSTQAALEATSTFGNLFVALGLSQEAAAELSPDIVQLAADLASFNNIPVGDALEKLRSGLVGEAEPLRVLGVNINEAVVKAKALELGLVGTTGELSEAAKVQARYALILEQTVTAQGDFARTADGVANTQRTLTALWEDAQAAIGEALLPAYEKIIDILPTLIGQLEDLGPAIGLITTVSLNAIQTLGDLATTFGDLAVFAGDIATTAAEMVGLGQAGEEAGGGLSDLVDSVVGGLNPVSAFQRAIEDIETRLSGVNPNTFKDVIEDLTDAAAKGVNPLQSLALALNDFLANSELTADALEAIISASGIEGENLTKFLSNTIKNADRLKISAAGVRVLKDALVELQDFSRRTPGGGGLEVLPGADPETAQQIEVTTDALARMDAELAQIMGVAQTVAPTVGIEAFLAGFDAVQESMEAARQALHDDEGEIITDLDTFFDNLNTQFAEQLEFARGIATLRSRGQDQLADFFQAEGEGALEALNQAINDPAKANEIETTFEQQQEDLAAAGFHAFDSALKQLILGLEPPPVVIPLTFGGLPDFPISALTAGQVGPAGKIEVNFYDTPQPTTDTTRITQSVAAITRTGGPQ